MTVRRRSKSYLDNDTNTPLDTHVAHSVRLTLPSRPERVRAVVTTARVETTVKRETGEDLKDVVRNPDPLYSPRSETGVDTPTPCETSRSEVK